MKFDGWRKIMPREGLNDVVLPRLEEGEKLGLVGVRPVQKFTQPPARYNEASIVKTLEKLGIGRPSTYAPIISTIQARQYVEKKDGKFYATPVGIAVTEFLLKNFPQILDYQFTAQMEDDLDRVAEGKRDWVSDIKSFYEVFHSKLAEVTDKSERVPIPTEKIGEKCPQCGKGDLVIRIGRFGKFISCSDFPSCKYVAKYVEKIGMKCPKCGNGDVIIKRTAKGRKFFGCSRYPDCDYASWRSPKPLEAAE
jgi:DNA topoisomerase-1